jgi:uncharacterized protein YndB with AHSA1/START domain
METADNATISIETIIHASVEKVWKAWTDPGLIMNWFGSDPGGKVLEASLDVRPDGCFEITFRDSDQTEHTCCGVYNDVQENSRLTFSWMWKSEPGVESFITVSFVAEANNTVMGFVHANVGTASKHDYSKGWRSTFVKLDYMLSGR